MRITESLRIETDRKGYQEVCSDCEVYGLKKHGLTGSDWTVGYLVVATIETTSKVVVSDDTKHLRCTVTSQSPYVYHRLGMVNVRVFKC